MSISKQIEIIENILSIRNQDNLTEEQRQIKSSFSHLADDELEKDLEFYQQLSLGWIYLDNFKVDYDELKNLYENCEWIPIYQDTEDYQDSQSYAEINTPKFVINQIDLPIYMLSSFLRIHPNAVLRKHHHETGRSCALIVPYKGEQKNIPLQFWQTPDVLLSEVIVDRPTLINTNVLHGIDRTSTVERTNYNLNFDFPFSFESISYILKKGFKF